MRTAVNLSSSKNARFVFSIDVWMEVATKPHAMPSSQKFVSHEVGADLPNKPAKGGAVTTFILNIHNSEMLNTT